ncbi:hypothetical protein AVEN_129397-1, partial [Araneus ventricosus]
NVFPLDDTFAKTRLARPSPVTEQEPFQVQKSPPNQDITGIFDSNFHEPSQKLMGWEMTNSIFNPTTAQSGAKKKGGGGDIMHSSSWGMPEEVRTFGRFFDFDEDVPVLTRKQGLKQSSGGWSEPLLPSPSYELCAIEVMTVPNVTSNIYLGMLQLYAVAQFPEGVIFQQDGTPPHYGNIVREFLDATFPQRWIGRGAVVA